jgi:putative transposase
MMSEWSISQRRVCGVLQLDPKSYRYKSRRPAQAVLEAKIKEICQTRISYRYRRVNDLLRREGWMINWKKTRRIYRELGLQMRSKTPKRRVKTALRDDRAPPSRAHQTWAMDFVHDQLATGSKLRILTIADLFSRFSPAIDMRFSYRGRAWLSALSSGDDDGASALRIQPGGSTHRASWRRPVSSGLISWR